MTPRTAIDKFVEANKSEAQTPGPVLPDGGKVDIKTLSGLNNTFSGVRLRPPSLG